MIATQLFGEGQTEITQDRIKDLPKHIRDEITRDTTQPLVKIDPAITDKLDTSRKKQFFSQPMESEIGEDIELNEPVVGETAPPQLSVRTSSSDRPMRIEDLQSSRRAIDMSIASSLHRQMTHGLRTSTIKDLDYPLMTLSIKCLS
ncbi:hypothetical protein P9112_002779 [Eukaryota sp. TZLM1-RC]